MSKYTTQLRFICEQLSCLDTSVDFSNIDLVIESAYHKIFDFDFPIFDEKYRKPLCKKILRHYYFKEIGFETYALWKANLCIVLNDIMPYYNQLYKSQLLDFNPFYTVDVKRKHNKNFNENTTNDTTENTKSVANTKTEETNEYTSNSDSTSKYSDTPQGTLDNIENDTYLTNVKIDNAGANGNGKSNSTVNNDVNSDLTNNQNGSVDNMEQYYETVVGKEGGESYSDMLIKFRKTFINIDLQVIEELNDLFMLLW